MPQSKAPENTRRPECDGRSDDQMKHQPGRLPERFDQHPSRNICDDYHRHDPAKDETKQARINNVWIAGNIEEIEVAIDEALRAYDPKAEGSETEHDRIMNGDAKSDGHQIKHDVERMRRDAKPGKGDHHDQAAQRRIYYTIEAKLFRRRGKLAVDRQD